MTTEITGRCVKPDAMGTLWDRIRIQEASANEAQMVSVGGIVRGDEGALLLRLPNHHTSGWRDYLVSPAESRALLAALVARVGVAAGREVVQMMIAGGYQETSFADGSSEFEPLYEDGEG